MSKREEERGRENGGSPVHDIIWLMGMSILGEYIHTHTQEVVS